MSCNLSLVRSEVPDLLDYLDALFKYELAQIKACQRLEDSVSSRMHFNAAELIRHAMNQIKQRLDELEKGR